MNGHGERRDVYMTFAYSKRLQGEHPLLRRHYASWKIDELDICSDAWACVHQYSRTEFEADACLVGILLAVMAQRRVVLRGLATAPETILQGFHGKRWANGHFAQLAIDNWDMLQIDQNYGDQPWSGRLCWTQTSRIA